MKPRFCFDVCWDAYKRARGDLEKGSLRAIDLSDLLSNSRWRPRVRPLFQDFCADFQLAGRRVLSDPHTASRLILFNTFYVGLAAYRQARALLGISELTWVAWTEEIRDLVGSELERAGLFPVRTYFREKSGSARQS